ncbi:hypothetical protein EON65_02810 [archaeon]|nr:MAG: hypothetical protein EON65_02810 [archaeon]
MTYSSLMNCYCYHCSTEQTKRVD